MLLTAWDFLVWHCLPVLPIGLKAGIVLMLLTLRFLWGGVWCGIVRRYWFQSRYCLDDIYCLRFFWGGVWFVIVHRYWSKSRDCLDGTACLWFLWVESGVVLSAGTGQKAGIVLMLLTACGFSGCSPVLYCPQVLVKKQVLSWCYLLPVVSLGGVQCGIIHSYWSKSRYCLDVAYCLWFLWVESSVALSAGIGQHADIVLV